MKKDSPKADFNTFTRLAKEQKIREEDYKIETGSSRKSNEYRYLQVRVTNKDANRLKATIAARGLSVQSVLIESINHWMQEHKQPPIVDPGTSRDK